MNVKKLIAVFVLAIVAISLVGCDDIGTGHTEYVSTPEQAYEEGKLMDLGSKVKIKKGIDEAKVSDDVIIWIATNTRDEFVVAPMTVENDKYYFTGKETDFYISHITKECVDITVWDSYNLLNNSTLTLDLYEGTECNQKGMDGYHIFKYKNKSYVLVWTYNK